MTSVGTRHNVAICCIILLQHSFFYVSNIGTFASLALVSDSGQPECVRGAFLCHRRVPIAIHVATVYEGNE